MDVARAASATLASSSSSNAMPSFRQEAGLSSLQGEGGSGKAPQKVHVNVAVERIRTQVHTLHRDLNFSMDASTAQVSSDEHRGGKEDVVTGRSRVSHDPKIYKQQINHK